MMVGTGSGCAVCGQLGVSHGAMAGFSISSWPQSLLRPVPAMPGSLRYLEPPKTWVRAVQDCCAVVMSVLSALFARTREKPRLLFCYSLIEEKTGSFTGMGTCRVFV